MPHGSLPRCNVGDDATISKLNDGLRKKVNPILIAVSIRYAQVEWGGGSRGRAEKDGDNLGRCAPTAIEAAVSSNFGLCPFPT